jgi:cytochrome c oxidase cbb3-type subunit 2
MWEKRPVLLLLLATVTILVGTVITMVLPFAWVNTESDAIAEVTPYNALELEGRDIYVREGCNNCHSQTVRPLEADVKRYGPYSRSGEFVYDRPFLWGSRRMGPDLARIGKKYSDEWHYRHMVEPTAMVPETNMPAYAFLKEGTVDPAYTQKKMEVLDFPFTGDEIAALEGKTELDAMVAYLQKLGTDLPQSKKAAQSAKGLRKADVNPFAGDVASRDEGEELYGKHCAACHGKDRGGVIGPELEAGSFDDDELFDTISGGVSDGGMPSFSKLGRDRLWKLVTFLQSEE